MGKNLHIVLLLFLSFGFLRIISLSYLPDEEREIGNLILVKPEDNKTSNNFNSVLPTKNINDLNPVQTGIKKPETIPNCYSFFQKILYIAAKIKAIKYYCIFF